MCKGPDVQIIYTSNVTKNSSFVVEERNQTKKPSSIPRHHSSVSGKRDPSIRDEPNEHKGGSLSS